jgi:hypothetical protein
MIYHEKWYRNTIISVTEYLLKKYAKLILNIVYLTGVTCVLSLLIVVIFGSDELPNPDAMVSMKFSAFIWLIIGTLPMNLSCISVYIFNNVKKSSHGIRNTIFIFIPGFICFGFFLFMMLAGTIINLYTKYFQ